jgi:membrane protease YdiL (CAAX protease family)
LHALESTTSRRSERTLQLALFVTSLVWFLAADTIAVRAARGICERLSLDPCRSLLTSIFLLFLLGVGFSALQAISSRNSTLRDVLGLPRRSTVREEWTRGAALGWGLVVLAILPMAIAGTWSVHLWTEPRAFGLLLLNLVTLAVAALAEEVAFRGYAFRRLIQAIGPVAATICISLLFGLAHMFNPNATWISTLVTMLAGLLLAIAWLRTHGLWLGWGFHFAWNAGMAILFGLPLSGIDRFASVIQTRTIGRLWLTGGDYGPEGAAFTVIVLLIGIAILVRLTRDYAWDYTYAPIVAAGYPMDAPVPAAHVAMEQQAVQSAPPSLVQILPTTPQTRSVEPDPKP